MIVRSTWKLFNCLWAVSIQAESAYQCAGRVHMAAPAQRAVSGARRERNSNKHKRLFLPGEPGGLTVSLTPQCIA